MNRLAQSKEFLQQYLKARDIAPWLADCANSAASEALRDLGGMQSNWRTDYHQTCYAAQQLINGEYVDLSTPEKVRAYYASKH